MFIQKSVQRLNMGNKQRFELKGSFVNDVIWTFYDPLTPLSRFITKIVTPLKKDVTLASTCKLYGRPKAQ